MSTETFESCIEPFGNHATALPSVLSSSTLPSSAIRGVNPFSARGNVHDDGASFERRTNVSLKPASNVCISRSVCGRMPGYVAVLPSTVGVTGAAPSRV